MTKKSIAFLSIFLVSAILIAGGVLYWQGNNQSVVVEPPIIENEEEEVIEVPEMDTSNWKTYRNEEYGFEVKYPADIYNIKDDDYIPMVSFNTATRELKEKYGDIQVLYMGGLPIQPLDEATRKSISDNYRLVTLVNKEVYYSDTNLDCLESSLSEYCHVPGSFFFISGEEYLSVRRVTFSDMELPESLEPVFVNFVSNLEMF